MTKLGQIVLKGVNWVHNRKSGHMILKGVLRVQNEEIRLAYGLERSQFVHNDKIRSNGLVRSQFGTQYKNQVIWS